ncbi:hypothetical protein NXG30_27855, partial [Klebsiella pneumoniae]|nr:hypothetical protein [Klebsiella pneumoniae]
QTETEATGAPQKHHYTLNQQVGSITGLIFRDITLQSITRIAIGSLQRLKETQPVNGWETSLFIPCSEGKKRPPALTVTVNNASWAIIVP